jgi:DNA-binding transcriptional ArsR family regulator
MSVRADLDVCESAIQRLEPPVAAADAAQLLHAPTEWRDLLLSALQRFWERVYREQWEATREQLARSAEYHRRRSYPADFGALFQTVTGRQIPERMRARLAEVEHVRFVPSLYLGPYVSFLFDGSIATIFYNGEGTPASDTAGPQIEDLYHPLTALADKTRLAIIAMLSGRELYAQEIVDRLGISQSAVSRHLQLMVDMKVLHVRRGDRGAKYYSINTEALQFVAQRLTEFR